MAFGVGLFDLYICLWAFIGLWAYRVWAVCPLWAYGFFTGRLNYATIYTSSDLGTRSEQNLNGHMGLYQDICFSRSQFEEVLQRIHTVLNIDSKDFTSKNHLALGIFLHCFRTHSSYMSSRVVP